MTAYTVLQDPRRGDDETIVGKISVDENDIVKIVDPGKLWAMFIEDSSFESFTRLSAHYPYVYKKERGTDAAK